MDKEDLLVVIVYLVQLLAPAVVVAVSKLVEDQEALAVEEALKIALLVVDQEQAVKEIMEAAHLVKIVKVVAVVVLVVLECFA
jgi:hypothetical protein